MYTILNFHDSFRRPGPHPKDDGTQLDTIVCSRTSPEARVSENLTSLRLDPRLVLTDTPAPLRPCAKPGLKIQNFSGRHALAPNAAPTPQQPEESIATLLKFSHKEIGTNL